MTLSFAASSSIGYQSKEENQQQNKQLRYLTIAEWETKAVKKTT